MQFIYDVSISVFPVKLLEISVLFSSSIEFKWFEFCSLLRVATVKTQFQMYPYVATWETPMKNAGDCGGGPSIGSSKHHGCPQDRQAFHHFIGGLTSSGNIKLRSLTSMSSVAFFDFRGLKSSDSQVDKPNSHPVESSRCYQTPKKNSLFFFYQVFCIFQVKQINLRRTKEQCHGI